MSSEIEIILLMGRSLDKTQPIVVLLGKKLSSEHTLQAVEVGWSAFFP